MKVKIGDTIYSSDNEPLMVVLTDAEKCLISEMRSEDYKFCVAPINTSKKDLEEFIG